MSSNFEYEINNDNKRTIQAKKKYRLSGLLWRLTLGLLSVTISAQVIGEFLLNYFDIGWSMSLAASISILFIYALVPDRNLRQIVTYEKKDIDLDKLFYFYGLMLALAIVCGLIVKFIIAIFSLNVPDIRELIMENFTFSVLTYGIVIGVIREEIIYRGILLQNLASYSPRASLIISTLAFAFMHGNLEQSLSVIGISFIINYVGLYYSWKSALLLHFINNASTTFIYYLILKFGEDSFLPLIPAALLLYIAMDSVLTFAKDGRKEMAKKLKFSPKEKRISRKILFSLPVILIMVLYLYLMFLSLQ